MGLRCVPSLCAFAVVDRSRCGCECAACAPCIASGGNASGGQTSRLRAAAQRTLSCGDAAEPVAARLERTGCFSLCRCGRTSPSAAHSAAEFGLSKPNEEGQRHPAPQHRGCTHPSCISAAERSHRRFRPKAGEQLQRKANSQTEQHARGKHNMHRFSLQYARSQAEDAPMKLPDAANRSTERREQ